VKLIDYAVIALYFAVVIGFGFWYRKRASQNLEAYFLGGKRMHWLALAMSGSVSNFDITGTMWIVSMLFILGMRSMWIHWMWGWMMGAFFLAYMGKWIRRSNVMTGAEWMITRFGHGTGGQAARMSAAIVAVITMCGMIGYAFQGIGKFAHVYIPGVGPNTLAVAIISATTFYVLLGGLFSVVVTDVIQTVVVTLAAIIIAVVAYNQISPEALSATLPADWASLMPKWRLSELAGTENHAYHLFGALVLVWVVRGLLLNAGGPGGMYELQRFLAAADTRDAAKIGAAWSVFMVVRWGMAMGITLLALVKLPDIADAEQVMPAVLQQYLPVGLKGLVIAGLLAAFMSTFSSTVNSGASYVVRDLWEPFIRRSHPETSDRHLVRASYVATVGIVIAGILIGHQAKSIAQIWEWLMMALGAAVIMPNVLRWYWWRMNGWGYAAGTLGGILLSLFPLFMDKPPMYAVFPPIAGGSLLACIMGTYLTRPVDDATLTDFFTRVRPFGIWGPVRRRVGFNVEALNDPKENPWRAVLNTVLGMVAVTGLYLFPMYLVGHWHGYAALCLGAALVSLAALAVTWYPYLPQKDETCSDQNRRP
jgi:solute:Na+ symporter, SSS family